MHGDDFTFTGYDEDLDFVTEVWAKQYELKLRGKLGPDEKDIKKIDILGRILEYTHHGAYRGVQTLDTERGFLNTLDLCQKQNICQRLGAERPIKLRGSKARLSWRRWR